MFNVNNYEYDCTRKCKCMGHANVITNALTKRSVSDEKLAAFIAKTCANYCDIVDDLGRSAVHLAASVNRYAVLEWLINQGAIINARDFESGSSPLHRAIYYGCIDSAVLLLRYGASPDLLDEDTRCAFQSVCRLCDDCSRSELSALNELLVWGSNKNYNLGIGNEQGSQTPQAIDFFRKERISIKAVAMGAYHSLFLDCKNQLYAVGHGNGGRLGIGTDNSLATPKRVKLTLKQGSDYITCLSASRHHSLVMTKGSLVFACGINEHAQLGIRDAGAKLSVFKEVITLRDCGATNMLKVIAKDYHSLAYGENYIYVWGSNCGQMGMEAAVSTVTLPKLMKLPPRTAISFVEANIAATIVYTKENLILLYYNYKMKTIKPPNFEALKSISVVGGDSGKFAKGTATALKLLMLTQTNVVFMWYEMTQSFYRCIFSQIRLTQIDKIIFKANQMLILSQGDVYKGKCNQIAVPTYAKDKRKDANSGRPGGEASNIWSRCDQNRTEISKDHMIRIDLQRIASIDRAVDIISDDDFSSFAALLESQMKYFKLPTLTPEEYSFKKLYHEVTEFDAIHDVLFHVDGELFPAHKFIVYARAPWLREIINSAEDKHVHLNFDRLSGKMFELMLKYMYTNYLPNEEDLQEIQKSLGPDSPQELVDVCHLFQHFVQQFQIKDLNNYLTSYLQQPNFYLPHLPDKSKYRFNRLRRTDFAALYDVRIICAGDLELQAHKCILVARLEYFDMMFTHAWAENTVINLTTVPIEYMEPIIDFLYSSDVEHFRKQNYSQTFLYNMIVFCDQFFIERLRKVCEILILDKISIRKCGDMLDFACMYNCETLKRGCMEFICQNLERVLTQKCLEYCEPESLNCINEHYRKMFKHIFDYRMITPDSEAIDDDLLHSFVDDFQVDLNYRMDENEDSHKHAHNTSNKLKTKEAKTNCHTTKQYEREAIHSMMESMSLNDSCKSVNDEKPSKNLQETRDIAEKLQAEAKSWMKVVEKKDNKKRWSHENTLKGTMTLKTEEAAANAGEMELLTKRKEVTIGSPIKELTTPIVTTTAVEEAAAATPPKVYNLNLADFTSPREKLSQKQRKRLSSESSSSWRAPVIEAKPLPVAQPNAWGVLPASSSSSNSVAFSPPATGSAADSSSFANMARANAGAAAAATSPNQRNDNEFARILADERKQRSNYERMRTKSLALTQIEEKAIAELREFYNVENVTDEIITIERKALPATMNFAVWQRN